MGLITGILTFPFAPVRGVVAVGELIQRQAEEELYSPASIRARLEEIEDQRQQDRITDEEADQAEQAVLAQIQQ
jgi:hypothetical protein